jgi:hypothetical protein
MFKYKNKKTKHTILNFGPRYPAAPGVLRLVLELHGENLNSNVRLMATSISHLKPNPIEEFQVLSEELNTYENEVVVPYSGRMRQFLRILRRLGLIANNYIKWEHATGGPGKIIVGLREGPFIDPKPSFFLNTIVTEMPTLPSFLIKTLKIKGEIDIKSIVIPPETEIYMTVWAPAGVFVLSTKSFARGHFYAYNPEPGSNRHLKPNPIEEFQVLVNLLNNPKTKNTFTLPFSKKMRRFLHILKRNGLVHSYTGGPDKIIVSLGKTDDSTIITKPLSFEKVIVTEMSVLPSFLIETLKIKGDIDIESVMIPEKTEIYMTFWIPVGVLVLSTKSFARGYFYANNNPKTDENA